MSKGIHYCDEPDLRIYKNGNVHNVNNPFLKKRKCFLLNNTIYGMLYGLRLP